MTVVTFLGAAGLGFLLVIVGIFFGFTDADMEAGGDGDFDAGGDSDVDLGGGLSLLSMTGMGAVLAGFGLVGYTALAMGLSPWLAVVPGLVGSWALFRATAWVRQMLVKNLDTGTAAGEQDLVYQPATVTIPIPATGPGRGQVLVRKGGRTFYVPAVSDLTRELSAGEQVVITESREGVYVVDLLK